MQRLIYLNLKTHFPHASQDFLKSNGEIPSGITQPTVSDALVEKKKRGRTIRGRTRVCYRGFFVRPLDADNLAAGTKQITDTLTRCGLLPADDPYNLSIKWEQEKVVHFADERIEIEITKP